MLKDLSGWGFFLPPNASLARLGGEFHTDLKWYQVLLQANISPSVSGVMQIPMHMRAV